MEEADSDDERVVDLVRPRSVERTELEDEGRPEARPDAKRRSYLITWPHTNRAGRLRPNEKSREEFAEYIKGAYASANLSPPHQFVVVRELHQSGDVHFHAAVNHAKQHRWRQLAAFLRARGVFARFDEFDDYPQAVRYLVEESASKPAPDLDTCPFWSRGHPPMSGSRRVTDVPREPAPEASPSKRRRATFSLADLYDVVTSRNIRTEVGLLALAHEDRRLVEFCMKKQGKVQSFINQAWNLANAEKRLQRQEMSRLAILKETAEKHPCVCGGSWNDAAVQIITQNGLQNNEVQHAIYRALALGRRKFTNVALVGPRNCGKSFLLAPLCDIYRTFQNPQPGGSYPLVGLLDAEMVYLDDFRYTPDLMRWNIMLIWLGGGAFQVPVPKNVNSCDETYEKSAPVFITSKAPLVKTADGCVDEGETEMMDARVNYIRLSAPIQNPRLDIRNCPRCFANFVLSAGVPPGL